MLSAKYHVSNIILDHLRSDRNVAELVQRQSGCYKMRCTRIGLPVDHQSCTKLLITCTAQLPSTQIKPDDKTHGPCVIRPCFSTSFPRSNWTHPSSTALCAQPESLCNCRGNVFSHVATAYPSNTLHICGLPVSCFRVGPAMLLLI